MTRRAFLVALALLPACDHNGGREPKRPPPPKPPPPKYPPPPRDPEPGRDREARGPSCDAWGRCR